MFQISLVDSFVDSKSELNNLADEQSSAEHASSDQNDSDHKQHLQTEDATNGTCSADEERTRYFKFKISNEDFKFMIEHSVRDKNPLKPFRYLTGNFMRPFEKQVELIEGEAIPIQKRNNILYVEASRNNTVYLRINGDCKLCPKISRVRYVFTVRNRPKDNDKLVEIEGRRKGVHMHDNQKDLSSASSSSATISSKSTEEYQPCLTDRDAYGKRIRTNIINGRKLISHMIKSKNERPKRRKICEYDSKVNTSSFKNLNGSNGPNSTQSVLLTTAMNSAHPPSNSSLTNATLNGASLPTLPTSVSYSSSASSLASGQLDKQFVQQLATQIAGQITSKLMIKLDQINLKINAINDKLYDMERKLDNLESSSDIII
jgi:hypothetical protein